MMGMGMPWWGTGGFTTTTHNLSSTSTGRSGSRYHGRMSRWGSDQTRGNRMAMSSDRHGWGYR